MTGDRDDNWGTRLAESFLARPEDEQREMLQSARDAVLRAMDAGAQPAVIVGGIQLIRAPRRDVEDDGWVTVYPELESEQ